MSVRVAALALLLLVAAPCRADVVLNGYFHTGDEDDRPEFLPADPVNCNKYRTYPSRFNLTQSTTITTFTLHDAVSVDDTDITVSIDGTTRTSLACAGCLVNGNQTIDLLPDVTLAAGDHTIAVFDPSGTSGNCTDSNDFSWSKLTLNSTASTTSIMLSQRRHVGDDADSDDDYDFTGNATTSSSEFYPDNFDGTSASISFTLTSNLRLTEIGFNRMRDVNTTSGNHATVTVDGNSIGSITTTGDPYTLSTTLLLAAGSHTLVVTSGTLSGQRDDISWDGIILKFSDTGSSGSLGFFNAVDVGENALTGKLRTKIAGGSSSLDLYAMNGFGTGTNASFNGGATVDVLDSSNSSGTTDIYGCNSTWTVAQSLGAVTFSAGHASITPTWLDAGLKNARIRVTDSTTQARGCSVDNAAIRPNSLGVAPSHASETTAGVTTALTNTATTGLQRHKAGQPFTIVATGRTAGGAAVSNYDGSPTAATSVAVGPATVTGTLTLGSWGAASGGARRTDTATYSEVGAVTIALEDTSWANVDAADSTAAQRTITGTGNAGRFIPDHFNVTDGTLAPGCAAGAFSYLGDTLSWATPAVTLTAVNASNATTQNYATGTFEALPATIGAPGYTAQTGSVGEAVAATPTVGDAVAGVATITLPALKFTRSRVAAFNAEIAVTLPVFADDDGVVPAESPIVIGATTTGNGVAFTGNAKSQRFGRLYFEPTYGSERLPMTVPLRAEYFDGTTFVTNTADNCTVLTTTSVTLTPLGGQTHSVASSGTGIWTVTLTAPNVPGQAGLSIDVITPGATVPYPLLAADTDGNDTYAEDPATTVTFGLYSQDQRRIFQREMVGN